MPEFLELLPPDEALQTFLQQIDFNLRVETIKTEAALGRVTASSIFAPHPLPPFPMGDESGFEVDITQCALIHTGGMLPIDTDAVVMVENTQIVREDEVEILHSVAFGENVIKMGEDVFEGEEVIPAGKVIRPAEIGGLMAFGIVDIEVARQPLVGIISSGDEVIPPWEDMKPGQVRDINSYSLSALIQEVGGIPIRYGIVSDQAKILKEVVKKAISEMDLVIITAGSSASTRDLTSQVINELGEPGVIIHGVNVRPGKPTILGVCKGKPVIGLPGNPVSALVIASLFVKPVLLSMMGRRNAAPFPSILASISLNIPSKSGREDWIAVRLNKNPTGYEADPVFGKSNLIYTLSRADGLICIPPDATGINAGEKVKVFIL